MIRTCYLCSGLGRCVYGFMYKSVILSLVCFVLYFRRPLILAISWGARLMIFAGKLTLLFAIKFFFDTMISLQFLVDKIFSTSPYFKPVLILRPLFSRFRSHSAKFSRDRTSFRIIVPTLYSKNKKNNAPKTRKEVCQCDDSTPSSPGLWTNCWSLSTFPFVSFPYAMPVSADCCIIYFTYTSKCCCRRVQLKAPPKIWRNLLSLLSFSSDNLFSIFW